MRPLPHWTAFHDFALQTTREPTGETPRVKDAITDSFGSDKDLVRIGIVGPEKMTVNDRGNYLEPGESEAVMVASAALASYAAA